MTAVLATDEATLLLTRCANGQSAWAFAPLRAEADVPPPATMCAGLRRLRAQHNASSPSASSWTSTDAAADAIAAELSQRHFAIVDDYLPQADIAALRRAVVDMHAHGKLEQSELAGGATGSSSTAYTHSATRGDHIAWYDGTVTDGIPALGAYLHAVDGLVYGRLRERVPSLGSVRTRSRAMIAAYPGGGARYARHCDNSCSADGSGERCNGRRLTAILYLNEAWHPAHGGELRLHGPFTAGAADAALAELREWVAAHKHSSDAAYVARELPRRRAALARATALADGGPAVCDIAPLSNRLVLFYADYRVPHEVLPTHAMRLAATVWYFDDEERERALANGATEP